MKRVKGFFSVILFFGLIGLARLKNNSQQDLITFEVNSSENYDSCKTPNEESGECILINNCPSLFELLQKRPLTSENVKYLKRSHCGFVGKIPKVCCKTPGQETTTKKITSLIKPLTEEEENQKVGLLPDLLTCGIQSSNRIYGGEKAELDEYPWMALLEYEKANRQHGFYCGGVLISKRYVLTASHCIKGKDLPKSWKLVSVRLGEYDLDSDKDCVSNGFGKEICTDTPIDVPVEEQIPHEMYNPYDPNQYHDIALLRLSRDVKFTNYIRPICLPLADNEKNQNYTGQKLTVAGWGKTETRSESNIILKLQVPVKSHSECNSKYQEARVDLSSDQLCAGGEKGKDSCRGDSGGPLMTISTDLEGESNWFAAGVVSFGPSPCGTEGWPGVYTRVANYIPWILSKIKN